MALAGLILSIGIQTFFPNKNVDDYKIMHKDYISRLSNDEHVMYAGACTLNMFSGGFARIIRNFFLDYTPCPHLAGILTMVDVAISSMWRHAYLCRPSRLMIVAGTIVDVAVQGVLMWSMVRAAGASRSQWPLVAAALGVPVVAWSLNHARILWCYDKRLGRE